MAAAITAFGGHDLGHRASGNVPAGARGSTRSTSTRPKRWPGAECRLEVVEEGSRTRVPDDVDAVLRCIASHPRALCGRTVMLCVVVVVFCSGHQDGHLASGAQIPGPMDGRGEAHRARSAPHCPRPPTPGRPSVPPHRTHQHPRAGPQSDEVVTLTGVEVDVLGPRARPRDVLLPSARAGSRGLD